MLLKSKDLYKYQKDSKIGKGVNGFNLIFILGVLDALSNSRS